MNKILSNVLEEYSPEVYSVRKLMKQDSESLFYLIHSQDPYDLKYFHPHGFDWKSIVGIFKNPALLKMGIFHDQKLIGYFFLRLFANKKCFVGRLIDRDYRGKGIGIIMNNIMYQTAWKLGFRCLSTISKNNELVLRAHLKNHSMVVLKELNNEYLLVEFIDKMKFSKTTF